ncbi:MAG: WhiB family transcriptional regulator, redox-sensing transcriptional regulator [Acidimicrobiaceae bacterium]|nr:WhiB family transcriptional regulator, redox-sensing transcriptional regulator [Acidimicrobiaceae bacterium]
MAEVGFSRERRRRTTAPERAVRIDRNGGVVVSRHDSKAPSAPQRVTSGRAAIDKRFALDMMSVLAADADGNPWRDRAACQSVSADLFFPIGRTGDAVEHIEAAKAVCRTCPVREACLRFAIETNQEAGIWGGTSEEERDRIRRAWLARRRRERVTA